MSLSLEHLRCEVSNGAAEGFRSSVVVVDALLGEPEVSQQGMPFVVKYNVIGLQISENDISFMQIL